MTPSRARRPYTGTMRRSLAMLLTCFSIVCWAATSSVRVQSGPRAEANQLHAAIVNGVGRWPDDMRSLHQASNSPGRKNGFEKRRHGKEQEGGQTQRH